MKPISTTYQLVKMNNSNIQFLTVSEVHEKTGKSQSSIMRIINEYKGTVHVKREGKKYLISSHILSQLFTNYSPTIHLNSSETTDNTKDTDPQLFTNYSPTIQMNSLIEAKNETIEILKNVISSQADQINELIQRNRESNIIIKSLQEQIKLPEKAQPMTTISVKPEKHTNTPLIMDLHAQGLKYSDIAEQLNARGLKNQYGKKYTREAIKTTVNRNK
jgi:hypothetical protein